MIIRDSWAHTTEPIPLPAPPGPRMGCRKMQSCVGTCGTCALAPGWICLGAARWRPSRPQFQPHLSMLNKNLPLWFSLRTCEHVRNETPVSWAHGTGAGIFIFFLCPGCSQFSENPSPPCPRHFNMHGEAGHCLAALEIMGTRRMGNTSLQANHGFFKLPPSPKFPLKRHDRELQRSLLQGGGKCRREKPLARLPHSRLRPRGCRGGICHAIKTFLLAKHETPKVYGKPLSSGCLHIFRHPGSCSSKKPRKSKQPIMMVSGWRLCDYWLPHESLNFWDAEPISAAK